MQGLQLGAAQSLLELMRPRQWVKNAFVLAPLLFVGGAMDLSMALRALYAFLGFSIAASSVYIFNDIKDLESDRLHPIKSVKRPLASGRVSLGAAWTLLVGLYAVLLMHAWVTPEVLVVLVAYIVMNILYTLYLKQQVVVDIFVIAIGFVLRVYAGAVAIGVPVSDWMFVTTLCLALYLASVKRRQELLVVGEAGRSVLKAYSVNLVDRYAEMSATGALVFYSMFVMAERPELIMSIPIVLFGLFRYWYLVEQTGGGESPTDVLLEDRLLAATVCVWAGWCGYVIWAS